MTSEVFVYLTLPGAISPLTAGRFQLGTDRQGASIGRFVYGRRYLERSDAVAIDPIELKLEERTFETARLHGMFGGFRDASPDYWGRRVIEKHAGKANLTELDYLLNSPDDRAGALGFGLNVEPPVPLRKFNRTMDLSRLQELNRRSRCTARQALRSATLRGGLPTSAHAQCTDTAAHRGFASRPRSLVVRGTC
jgi:serine/threonine-protein kinase HipA